MISTTQPAEQDSEAVHTKRLAKLLSQCKQGDEAAFEDLYRLSSAHVYGVLMRMLRSEAIAEEALQECYVKIWQKAGTYRAESGSPIAWMSGVARHQALDLLRKRRSREGHERTDSAEYIDATPDTTKPLHEMSEDARLLTQCLERLPAEARNCIVRAYCEGYSHEELSAQIDAPVGTIKSWIRRGLIALRRCIDEHT